AQPWAEDAWTGGRLRIGEATFHVPEGSGRCLVTTTDQETGERGHEPLRTLGRHRTVNKRILFATLLVPEGPAKVSVGDTVVPLLPPPIGPHWTFSGRKDGDPGALDDLLKRPHVLFKGGASGGGEPDRRTGPLADEALADLHVPGVLEDRQLLGQSRVGHRDA